jgi:hypothetical protein
VDQLRRWAAVRLGDNLLALDLPSVKRNLELVSVIRSVAIERALPHTLRISVTARSLSRSEQIVEFSPTWLRQSGGRHRPDRTGRVARVGLRRRLWS